MHGGNRRLLGVSLDVMDTFLDGLGMSLLVLCYVMLVHPLLDFPLALHLVLEFFVIVRQALLLGSTVSEIHVHTLNGEESTHHLNEDPNGVPALFPLGLWWWCCWHRVRTSQIVLKVFKVDGLGFFRDFVLDRESWSNKLVTFAILIFCPVPEKLK